MTEKKDMYDIIDDCEIEINEDEVIKEIMIQYEDLHEMLDFNEYTIKTVIEKNAYIYQQFRLLWLKERGKLLRIEVLMDKYIGDLFENLRFHDDRKLSKVEIEKYMIPRDDTAIKYKKLLIRQQIRVGTYETIKDVFKQQGFNMNLFIKTIQD